MSDKDKYIMKGQTWFPVSYDCPECSNPVASNGQIHDCQDCEWWKVIE